MIVLTLCKKAIIFIRGVLGRACGLPGPEIRPGKAETTEAGETSEAAANGVTEVAAETAKTEETLEAFYSSLKGL